MVPLPLGLQVFWDRALGLPLERPKSVTSQWILDYVKKNNK
jgi:citrate synthase